ncbi:MAG: sugar ABC transporter ATP-binding protein [Oscillospiraceae bacterium]|nr:sugar ABC transporter ATP-binding protein [Oscillospiraceae bacterium]
MKDGKTFIELKGIVKLFPGVRALGGVSFDIREGEVHSLCGENGAGKSTLIKVMTGAHARDEGQYLIDGEEVNFKSTQEAIAKGVSCVYQELSMAPQQDVAHNLFIGNLPMKGGLVDHKALYQKTEEVLEELEMTISPKAIAGELSVGQQQMIEIGRALTRNARLIIMDEPSSSLSEAETETLFKIIKKLTDKNIAVVYISHKLDEVMYLSDRITVIRDGENICTMDKDATTQDELITHMIGRPLEKQYPEKTGRSQGEVVLDVQNLTGEKFQDVSFQVHAGEVVGFFGLVGAGRSEIMRGIFGVDHTKGGSATVEGKKVATGNPVAAINAGVGFCTEDRKKEGLALHLSILLNSTIVKLPKLSKLGVINRKKQGEDADKYVTAMRTKTPSITQLVGNLSGGNQQKVVLAKWLTMEPRLLIVDEPTRGIDVGSKAEIYEIINDLAKQGMAIIVVSSEIEEILGVCDSVITIFEGKKTAQLPINSQLTSETVLACSIGKQNVIDAVTKGGATA